MNLEDAAILVPIVLLGPWMVCADIPMVPKLKFVKRERNKVTGLDSFNFVDKQGRNYVISLSNKGIDHFCSSSHILSKGRMGSAAIGIFLFSLPTLPLWLPFILPTNLYFRAKEKLLGKSRYAAEILWKAKSTMPTKDYEDLKAAFERDWARNVS